MTFPVMLAAVLSLLLTFLLPAQSSVFTASATPSIPHPTPSYPSPHLTFSLSAHHRLVAPPPLSSRFSLLQASVADSNTTGCAAIDFSGLVTINGQGPFRLIIDTGSTTLAVASSACTSCESVTPTFTPSPGSQTNQGAAITAIYGGGTSWSGHTWQSSVALGDSRAVSVSIATIESNDRFINGANVCAISTMAKTFLNTSQGIIGFSYPSIALAGTGSWISAYVSSTGVSNEFSLQLCPLGGNVWVGGYDGAFLSGAFRYVPVISPYYYSVMLTDVAMIDQYGVESSTGYTQATFGPCASSVGSDCTILDSGTTLILVPQAAYSKLVSLIRADSYYQQVFDGVGVIDPLSQTSKCQPASSLPLLATLQAKLPKLQFTIANADGSSPQAFVINSIPGYLSLNYLNGQGDASDSAFYCMGLGVSNGPALLGYAFMNQWTVRHDLTNQRVGLATTANCGVPAPPLPSYHWVTGGWGACSASCGPGTQWREVDCVDQYGVKHADLLCAAIYLSGSPRPIDSQQCDIAACAALTPPTFTAVASSSATITPGSSYTVTFAYTGADPDSVVLFLSPIPGSTTTLPSYIARNATGVNGAGSFLFTAPSLASIPSGSYHLGAYADASTGADVFTSTNTVTIAQCSSGTCGADPCAATGLCSGHGECDVVSGAAVCTCMPGWAGPSCSAIVNNGIPWCSNGGSEDLSSPVCDCPSSFTGPQCEQPYANLSMTVTTQYSTLVSAGYNAVVLTRSATIDLAFALGLYPRQITVQSIGATGSGATELFFSVQAQSSPADLVARVQTLTGTSTSAVLLASGLATGRLSSFAVLSQPPTGSSSGSQSARAWLSQWWPYILGGVGGFFIVFFLLYCIAGGRCTECNGLRRQKGAKQEPMKNVGVSSNSVGV